MTPVAQATGVSCAQSQSPQKGTSVKMIEDYYGHITPAKNAERILQGIPGWEPIADGSG
jgi:hypothetical protein